MLGAMKLDSRKSPARYCSGALVGIRSPQDDCLCQSSLGETSNLASAFFWVGTTLQSDEGPRGPIFSRRTWPVCMRLDPPRRIVFLAARSVVLFSAQAISRHPSGIYRSCKAWTWTWLAGQRARTLTLTRAHFLEPPTKQRPAAGGWPRGVLVSAEDRSTRGFLASGQ